MCVGGWVVWCGGFGWWLGGVLCCVFGDVELCLWLVVLCGKHSQVESVAGAAQLPNDYASVPR